MKYQALREDNEIFINFVTAILLEKETQCHTTKYSEELKLRVTKERLIELREQNFSVKEIAKILKCSEPYLINKVREFQLPRKRKKLKEK